MSPRNSPAGVVNMMRKTGCRRLIATHHSLGALLDRIQIEFASGIVEPIGLDIEEPPSFAYTYPNLGKETESTPFVPYPKAAERPVDHAIMCYLHSSGSTGFPKAIPMTYLTSVHWCTTRMYSPRVHINQRFPTQLSHSDRVRTRRFLDRTPSLCGAAPAFSCSWHVCTTMLSHCIPQDHVHVCPDILPRSHSDPCLSKSTQHNRGCATDQSKCTRRSPCVFGRMGHIKRGC